MGGAILATAGYISVSRSAGPRECRAAARLDSGGLSQAPVVPPPDPRDARPRLPGPRYIWRLSIEVLSMTHLVRALLAGLSPGSARRVVLCRGGSPQDIDGERGCALVRLRRPVSARLISPPTRRSPSPSGRHEYDGQLPGLQRLPRCRRRSRVCSARAATSAAFDGAQLGRTTRFERDYLAAVIDEQLFWRAEAQWPQRNPAYYLDDLDPEPYLNKPYAPLAERMRAYIAYARAIPRVAAQIRANLRTPMPGPWIEYGANAFNGFADFYANDVAAIYTSVKDAGLQADLRAANAAAAAAMRELGGWLSSQRATATSDFAIGAALFSRMLAATEQVQLPLERVAEIGRARSRAQHRGAGVRLQAVAAAGNRRRVRRARALAQGRRWTRRAGPPTVAGARGLRAPVEHRHDSERRAGARRKRAALQRAELCVHHRARTL